MEKDKIELLRKDLEAIGFFECMGSDDIETPAQPLQLGLAGVSF